LKEIDHFFAENCGLVVKICDLTISALGILKHKLLKSSAERESFARSWYAIVSFILLFLLIVYRFPNYSVAVSFRSRVSRKRTCDKYCCTCHQTLVHTLAEDSRE